MDKKTIIFLILFALSFGFNLFFINKSGSNSPGITPSYKLIDTEKNETVDSNIQTQTSVLHFSGLREQLEKEIGDFEAEENIGIFLQDSRTGAWLGINEREGFNPASLLKIPIMLAILKKVKLDEISLKDTLEIAEEDLDKNSGELYKKGAGHKLSIWKLIEEMILSSDNTAKNILKKQLTNSEINSIFAHVGIPNPYAESSDSLVTPRGYTRLFKSLYLSTYLTPELSEKALEIATDTKMESLLSAGVPYEIQVAHKYGERPDGISDCGIVYHPEGAYFLCVMTKDIEIIKAKELIANSSKLIYDFVSDQK